MGPSQFLFAGARALPLLFLLIGGGPFWKGEARADVKATTRVFTFRVRAEPETLDWNKAHTSVEAYLLLNLMEGLVTLDGSMKVVPALAQSWNISSDEKTYTFKIRPGVQWSDGVGLKAQDFVYSWKRLLSPLTAAAYAYFLYDIEGAESYNQGRIQDFAQVGVKALDNLTLQVKLTRPISHWIYVPTFWVTFPLRQDVVEAQGSGWEKPGRMVSLGPYSLVTKDIGSKIVMRANARYYGKRGNIDQVVALMIKDDATALSLYEAKNLDFFADISTVDLKRLKDRPDLKSFPHLKTGFLGFVTKKYPTSNLKFRRAIAMAIDKTKFSEVLYGGQQPAFSFVPPTLLGHSKKIGLTYDPIQARAELRFSGIDTTNPLRIEYALPNWDKANAVAGFVKSELKKNLGIDVVLTPLDNASYRTQLDLGNFPLFDFTWSADFPDPYTFLSLFSTNSGNNKTTWKNDEFEKGLQEAAVIKDPKLRDEKYQKLQKTLLEDEVVMVPLYYESNRVLIQPRVRNFDLNPLDFLYLRSVDVTP